MKKVAVLMAGGRSERLWPMSRQSMPKQFLPITHGDKTMIQMTVDRLLPMIEMEDVYVVTNQDYVPTVLAQLPDIPPENVLAEPMGRNTAPCIALAAAVLRAKYEDAIMMVLASDHLIEQEEAFLQNLSMAADFAEHHEALVTIGITPTYAETGYGYIKYHDRNGAEQGLYPVERFVEKPNMELAKQYLQSGNYLWNSGMFLWRVSVIANHFEALMPSVYDGMETLTQKAREGQLESVLTDVFSTFPSVSIDYGIMEHAQSIYVIPSTFTWLDVGNWNAMPKILQMDESDNAFYGDTVFLNAEDNVVHSDTGRMISLINVEQMAVVDTEDVLMICPRDKLDGIKEMLVKLRRMKRDNHL